MGDIKYCYPNTNVLKNKLDITDEKRLSATERSIVTVLLAEKSNNPIKGNFDFKHLKNIHRELFSNIYDWAGKERTIDIIKGESYFTRFMFLEDYANTIFKGIKKENFLIGLTAEKAIDRLAYYMGEVNALHPFREGNGRTQRLFIGYLANATGIDLKFEECSKDRMENASILSMLRKDNSQFRKMFNDIADYMPLTDQHNFLKIISKEALKFFNNCETKIDRVKENIKINSNIEEIIKEELSNSKKGMADWKNEINMMRDNTNNSSDNKSKKDRQKKGREDA